VPVTPPLCHHCRKKPVGRIYGTTRTYKRGPRVIDGTRWAWFCSKACAGAANAEVALRSPLRKARHTLWTQAAQRRCLQRLVVACRDVIDANGKVDPKDFVRMMMRELMVARCQAADTGRRQVRRALSAGLELAS
jgi:hypothetical protein